MVCVCVCVSSGPLELMTASSGPLDNDQMQAVCAAMAWPTCSWISKQDMAAKEWKGWVRLSTKDIDEVWAPNNTALRMLHSTVGWYEVFAFPELSEDELRRSVEQGQRFAANQAVEKTMAALKSLDAELSKATQMVEAAKMEDQESQEPDSSADGHLEEPRRSALKRKAEEEHPAPNGDTCLPLAEEDPPFIDITGAPSDPDEAAPAASPVVPPFQESLIQDADSERFETSLSFG